MSIKEQSKAKENANEALNVAGEVFEAAADVMESFGEGAVKCCEAVGDIFCSLGS